MTPLKLEGVLKAAGFHDVIFLPNATKQEITDALEGFALRVVARDREAGRYPTIFFYFSGHGFRTEDADYLAPSDYRSEVGQESAVSLSKLMDLVAPRANFFVFSDACRTRVPPVRREITATDIDNVPTDNPDDDDEPDNQRQARVKSFPGERALVSFATRRDRRTLGKAKQTDKNSPYAMALAQYLVEEGYDLKTALGEVREMVKLRTEQVQAPVYDDEGAGAGSFFVRPAREDHDKAHRMLLSAINARDLPAIERFIRQNTWSPHVKAAMAARERLLADSRAQ